MTEWLHFHFSLSCIGDGNGNPLQCSCLENPKDRGAWWASVYGVTQSQTRLTWLSSSSRLNNYYTVVEESCRYLPVMHQPSLIYTSSEFPWRLLTDNTHIVLRRNDIGWYVFCMCCPEVYGPYYILVSMASLLSLHYWHTITIRGLFHEDHKS